MHNLVLSPISTDELIRQISESVTAGVLKAVKKSSDEVSDPWLNLEDLIRYDPQKRTKPTFYGLVSRGEIPHYKKGKKLFFLKSEIDNWFRSGKVMHNIDARRDVNKFLTKK